MRSILVLVISLIMIQTAYAENTEVETLRVSGSGSCMPYHATYSPNTAETLIDFSTKPFDKVLVLMKNAEGFEKKVEATPYSGLMGFKGAFSTANVRVGKCSFTLSHAPQVNELVQERIQSASVKADEARLLQIQQQMDKLISVITQNTELPKSDSPVQELIPVSRVDPSYPIGVVAKRDEKIENAQQTKIIEPTVVPNDEWHLVRPMTTVQPIKSWKFEKERNAVLIELQKGRGYEVISAKNKKGDNKYKGKINNYHRILLPYMSDDEINIEIRDSRSNKFTYYFRSFSNHLIDGNNVEKLASQNPVNTTDSMKSKTSPVPSDTENKAPSLEILSVAKGERLSEVVKRVLNYFGYQLAWRTKDMSFDVSIQIPSKDAVDINKFLESVLTPTGFKYEIHDDGINRVVVVFE